MKILEFNEEKVTMLLSEKAHGSMRRHPSGDNRQADAYRAAFLWANGIDPGKVVSSALVHGSNVAVISVTDDRNQFAACDALVTDRKDIFLSMTAADCFPVYLYDPVKGVIALVHGGWRGVAANVLENTVKAMQECFLSDPTEIMAYVGPGLLPCHYEVSDDVAKQFEGFAVRAMKYLPKEGANATDPNADTWEHKSVWYLNLESAIVYRLNALGLIPTFITVAHQCTFCTKNIAELKPLPEKSVFGYQFFSYRRDKSDPLETQMAVFGMK